MYLPFSNGLYNGRLVLALAVINPRRACAARVTVVVLSVRLSVHILFSDYRLRDGL